MFPFRELDHAVLFEYSVPIYGTYLRMKLLGRNKLKALYDIDEQTDRWLVSWTSELSRANWKHAKDVLRQFPHAECTADTVFSFRVGMHCYSIEVSIMFPLALAVVSDLKRIKL